MEEKFLKIIKKYGILHQQKKLQEEVFELQEAIYEEQFCQVHNLDHVKEELADVMVLLNEISRYYGIEFNDLYPIMKYKVDRTINRMED